MERIDNYEFWLLRRKCWRKKGWWDSKKAAHKRAHEIYKLTGNKMYPYRCKGCGKVHLTKDITAKEEDSI